MSRNIDQKLEKKKSFTDPYGLSRKIVKVQILDPTVRDVV